MLKINFNRYWNIKWTGRWMIWLTVRGVLWSWWRGLAWKEETIVFRRRDSVEKINLHKNVKNMMNNDGSIYPGTCTQGDSTSHQLQEDTGAISRGERIRIFIFFYISNKRLLLLKNITFIIIYYEKYDFISLLRI